MTGCSMKPSLRLAALLLGAWLAAPAVAMSSEQGAMVAKEAARGSAASQVLLGVMYLHGDGGYAQNPALAAQWLERAALQGNVYAQQKLGDLYAQGLGVAKNPRLAADWWEKAAVRGSVRAQASLGLAYWHGEGVAQDYGRAAYWLKRAAVGGDAQAQFELSQLYRSGAAQPEAGEGADTWLSRSASQGYEEAVRFGHWLEDFGYQVEEYFHPTSPRLKKLAADGDAEAQYQLALRYETGNGEPRDGARAVQWYTRAALQGHRKAMLALAHIYREGTDGVPADAATARTWAQRAQESGGIR